MPHPTLSSPAVPSTAGSPTRTLPRLEAELLGLAGHLAAAQCRFLRLLAEFDDRAGWAGPGMRSCAHWLTWRIGMSLRTAHEHVRVAHALRRLPLIDEAFAEGRISYSKVRAITRVAVPPPDDPTPTGTAGSDTAGDGASEDASADAAAAPNVDQPAGGPVGTPGGPEPAANTERTLLQLALAGTASHVETVVRGARRMQADPARPVLRRSLTWRRADDGSLVLTARLAPADGAALIAAVDAAAGPAPAPVRHPVPSSPPAWRERADAEYPGVATDRLAARRADALLALVTAAADPAPESPPGPPRRAVLRGRADVVVHIEAGEGGAAIVGGPEIAPATAERLACDARARVLLSDRRGNRLHLGRRRRLASPAQIAALTVRDGGRCRFAGCAQDRHLHAHHVVHWLRGGPTDVDNLVLLCGFHHTLVHERGYGIRRSGDGWASLRPDGTQVPPVGEPLVGDVEGLIETHARAQLRIDPAGLTPEWAGERLDRHAILAHLLRPTGDPGDDPDADETEPDGTGPDRTGPDRRGSAA
ncbi:HNH endonuclease signature motif containing protein [Pseudonocardia hydrocarbonoxydans]|uniref:HNH nuclease domain-containing protein n=1 Tax=Pseudonocardia hydrocarbonoxydans TaxID=76726 RepID=A0A4Y3WS63_9PSEU|nr:HNH endonuclease signature motif containing protein [Pseudonocardia hydrocarbonoxydans]GEC20196.1 hypothetical protein PHY01_24790 [Pseudonocardia hydrocarbonoxydans]